MPLTKITGGEFDSTQGGLSVAGIITATGGFIGTVTGNVTGNTTGTHIGNVTAGSITINAANNTISGVTQSNVSNTIVTGIATFTNGPVLVGTATSTGTASQPLQVTGGAYVSGSIGIGTTNPLGALDINGSLYLTNGSLNGALLYNGAYTQSTNLDLTGFGFGNYLVSIRGIGTYHWNGILAVTMFDTADFGVSTIVSGNYQTTLTASMVNLSNGNGTLRLVFNRNMDNVSVRRVAFG